MYEGFYWEDGAPTYTENGRAWRWLGAESGWHEFAYSLVDWWHDATPLRSPMPHAAKAAWRRLQADGVLVGAYPSLEDLETAHGAQVGPEDSPWPDDQMWEFDGVHVSERQFALAWAHFDVTGQRPNWWTGQPRTEPRPKNERHRVLGRLVRRPRGAH